mgnify:CR=1 FL=1
MNKILLEGDELDLSEVKFPVLIHGEEGTGASFYTVSLAANLYSKGSRIIFLCGYEMAQQKFSQQIGDEDKERISFFTKELVEEFKANLASANANTIIFIKNIELFGEDILELILDKNKVIISGDINKYEFINELFQKHFATKIIFSEMSGMELPKLREYEGYFETTNLVGKTTIKI